MDGKKIIIGVTGGVAIYKTCTLIRLLRKAGAEMQVIMTKNAEKLVSAALFRSVSQSMVHTPMFDATNDGGVKHINLSQWADFMIIAPATANTIGKVANGIADNLLTTTIMAMSPQKPIFIAPAMNVNMWNNIAVQNNIKNLSDFGWHIILPESGTLADGSIGAGRMAEPAKIIQEINLIVK